MSSSRKQLALGSVPYLPALQDGSRITHLEDSPSPSGIPGRVKDHTDPEEDSAPTLWHLRTGQGGHKPRGRHVNTRQLLAKTPPPHPLPHPPPLHPHNLASESGPWLSVSLHLTAREPVRHNHSHGGGERGEEGRAREGRAIHLPFLSSRTPDNHTRCSSFIHPELKLSWH